MAVTHAPPVPPHAATQIRQRNALVAWMQQHAVISYFVIAFCLSWAVWIPMALAGARVDEGQAWPAHIPGLFGPMIAAFIMSAVVGRSAGLRDLLRRMAHWKVAGRWYLAALSPLLLYAGAVLALGLAGQGWPDLTDLGRFSGLPLVPFPVMWLLLLGAAYAEEIGWRGFAVQEMLKTRSLLWTAVVVGVLWSLWHVPSFFVIQSYRDMGIAILPMFTLGLVSGSILLAWLYRASGGSIFIVALWHGSYNLVSGTAAAKGVPVAVVSTAIMVWAAAVIVSEVQARHDSRRTKPNMGGIT